MILTPGSRRSPKAPSHMGGLTYIGNATNFMIYAVATERGVQMPSFFRYLIWSSAVLLPAFVIVPYVFLIPS